MSKKEELIILVDEIIKNYCQNIRCMQLMIEKGDSIYEGLDVEEAVAIFKKNAEGWLALRRKLDVIKNVTINSCTDEELGISDLIRGLPHRDR